MLRVIAFLGFLGVCLGAGYPTTYPFENERMTPTILPASTPSQTYDENDVGGYFYTFHMMGTTHYDDSYYPYAFTSNGCWSFGFVTIYASPPVFPEASWNCTLINMQFTTADFTGMAGKQKVCNPGECCLDVMGLPKFSTDQMDWHDWLNDRTSAGMCDDILEAQYCIYTNGNMQVNCVEYVPSQTERLVMFPCHDVAYWWWMTCPVFMTTGIDIFSHVEPELYRSVCTLDQSIRIQTLSLQPDRVCHTESYYTPNAAEKSSPNAVSVDDSSTVLTGGILGLLTLFFF